MSELPNETWTSAYLDGELTADERAQFKRWLDANPSAQTLLDELRAVSHSVQSLPRESLEPDFAKRVLEQAELAVLLPKGGVILPLGEVTARSDNKRVELASSPPSAGFDWRRWSRPLLWSAMASAAALLITFLSPQRLQHASRMARVETTESAGTIAELSAPGDRPIDSDSDSLFASHPKSGEQPMLKKEADSQSQDALPRDIAASRRLGVQSVELNSAPSQAKSAVGMRASEPLSRNLVVLCEVTPQAANQNYFARVLERNSVSVDVLTSSGDNAAGQSQLSEHVAVSAVPSRGVDDARQAAQSVARNQTIYVVEASERQLTNVLTDLQNDRADVLAVNVDPAPQLPSQQALTNFGRGYVTDQYSNMAVPAPAAAAPAQVSDYEAQSFPASAADPIEAALPQLEAAAEVPQPTADSPAEAHTVENSQPGAESDAGGLADRENLQELYLQNQVRQQIPIEDQQQLLDELEKLSDLPAAEAGQVADQAEKANGIQNRALQNNARARQINLPQLRQIGANVQLQAELPGVTQSVRAEPGMNRAKSAARSTADELSGGGSPSKDGQRRRYSEQRQLNSQAQSPAAATQQRRPPTAEPLPPADKQDVNEPLVTAVFVIQASPVVTGETVPASLVPAPNEPAAPTKAAPP